MEIHGAAYLYALAAAALSFVGFAAIVVILRQSLGAGLSRFQVLLMQVLIEHGFVAALFSFLPVLLSNFELHHEAVWQIASVLAAIAVMMWMVDYALRRYPAVTGQRRLPLFARINYFITFVVVVGLIINATGYLFHPQSGPYLLAISWILFQGTDIFLLSLKAFMRAESRPRRKRA